MDSDGDGVGDNGDAFPSIRWRRWIQTVMESAIIVVVTLVQRDYGHDLDGIGNNTDTDDDGDGVAVVICR